MRLYDMKFIRIIPKYNHLWAVKAFLKANGVFDQDSFVEFTNEE